VESYFSDIGGTLGLYLGMSLMSVVEFFELLLDLIIFAIIRCCLSMKAKRKMAGKQENGGGPPGSDGDQRMPWEAPPPYLYPDLGGRGPPGSDGDPRMPWEAPPPYLYPDLGGRGPSGSEGGPRMPWEAPPPYLYPDLGGRGLL